MLRIAFAILISAHALIHLLGVAKAFRLAQLPQLQIPISRPLGLVWLAAAALLLAAVVALLVAPRWLWVLGALGLVASQVVIIASWRDARVGTIPNAILLVVVAYSAFAWGPLGLRAEYERLVREGLAQIAGAARPALVTEADLASLPVPVARYLRFTGVVGTERPRGFRARMTGRIRSSATAPWMPFAAEQVNFYDPPRRYFWMEATRAGVPIDGLHAYGETDATMRIRLLSIAPVVDLSGPQLMRTETVTILNDMSIFAPASLLDPAIRWRELDARTVEATYTRGPHTVRAVLGFGEAGELVDFWSDDRPALAEDGETAQPQRWSTPLREYRALGPYRLATRGEGRYAAPTGEYTYLELEVLEVSTESLGRALPR